ncbi:MAG: hypothetical protein A2144_02220 [Chloroflexi bacterium RBG_16_50_9]|nr:MAG: hypothetical protein A2144_02220 [Chloroflexi bacterium RBG_16_50_9]
MPVLTGSMAPMIRPGDQVLVTFAREEDIRFGDILLFRRNGEFIVHRVLKKWRRPHGVYFLEQGDRRHAFGIVSASRAIGRVALVNRGYKICDLTSPLSRITSVALTAWLYLASVTVQLFKHSRNRIMKRARRVISRSLLLLSNLLIRACFVVWYPSGFFIGRGQKG